MDRRELGTAARRGAVDWLVPLVILAIGVVNVSRDAHSKSYPGSPVQHLVFLTLAVGALGLRRRAPLAAPLVAVGIVTWWSAALWPADAQGPFEGFLILVGAAYSIGALNTGRRFAAGAGALVAAYAVGQVVILAGGGRDGDLLPVAVWMAVGLAIGQLIHRRGEQARQARAEASTIASEQEERTSRAIEEERARIARELHDVVAHSLSVIVVQAGAERRTLQGGGIDPASTAAALTAIERAGREALVDLRRLLGLLRRTAEPAALAPQPGLSQLDDLIRTVRQAGIHVDLETTGDRITLPPGLDLTAYRIVQEALTNVLKHARARRVCVRIAFSRNHLELDVTDDGDDHAEPVMAGTIESGHGLIGMRERVSVFGGTVTAGPRCDGGWSVHTLLPVLPVAAD
jgi:signal transduction histidine kinase